LQRICHIDRSAPGFPATQHWTSPQSQPSVGRPLARIAALLAFILALDAVAFSQAAKPAQKKILDPVSIHHYFTEFYNDEREMLGTAPPVPWDWFVENIPLLDVPDKNIEEIYYFRWYSFQKHIKKTPDGFIIDEFLDNVPWAGKFNSINMAAETHIREARWLRDSRYVKDDISFWAGPDGEPRRYS
jgi:hypothetical protein